MYIIATKVRKGGPDIGAGMCLAIRKESLKGKPAYEIVGMLATEWRYDLGHLQQMPVDAYMLTCEDLVRHEQDQDAECDGYII